MSQKKKHPIVEALTKRAQALDAHELFNVLADLSSILSDKKKSPDAGEAVLRVLKPIVEKVEALTGRQLPLKKRVTKQLRSSKKKKTPAKKVPAKPHRLGD